MLKNEFDSVLGQFCSFAQLSRLIERFDSDKIRSADEVRNIDVEFQTWSTSLDKFAQKIADTHPSYFDLVYLPLNGLSIIGYGMNALHTLWKCQMNLKQSHDLVALIKRLYTYPYEQEHAIIAEQLLETAEKCCDPHRVLHAEGNLVDVDRLTLNVDFELMDELNFVALLHLFNDKQPLRKKATVLLKLCEYYSKRYKIFTRLRLQKETVETYKYKAYGQKEIEEEMDNIEIEKAFPTFASHFNDLLPANVLDETRRGPNDEDETAEEAFESHEEKDKVEGQKYLLNSNILPHTFNLVELILHDFAASQSDQVRGNRSITDLIEL